MPLDLLKLSKKELIGIIEAQSSLLESVKAEMVLLHSRVALLEEENRILKLKLDSSNSSKPPSSDMAKPKRQNRSLRQPSGRKRGGQQGHEGHTLEMRAVCDVIEEHEPGFCRGCGHDLGDIEAVLIERRQVVDLPPIVPIWTEHRVYSKTCVCGQVCKADFPDNVKAPVQYGRSIESLACYLSVRQYLPYKRMQELFSDVFHIKISQSCISNMISRFAQKGAWIYEEIKERVLSSQVVGSDETGAVVNGRKGWFWTWQNQGNTFLKFDFSRAYKVVKETVIEPLYVLVSDCWSPQLKTQARHYQICLAHIERELNYFIEAGQQMGKRHENSALRSYKPKG